MSGKLAMRGYLRPFLGLVLLAGCKPEEKLPFTWGEPGPFPVQFKKLLSLDAEALVHGDGSDYPWNRGPGVAVHDLNGDGWLDMVLVVPYHQSEIFFNQGDGHLKRSSTGLPAAIGVAAADLDEDGDTDLVFANRRDLPDQILWNDGTGGFAEVEDLPNSLGESRTPALADADGDGDLDLMISGFCTRTDVPEVATGDGHQLFLHEGNSWVEATDQLPASVLTSLSYHIAWVDIDQDNDNDLYITNDFGATTQTNQLLYHDGTGHFDFGPDCHCTPTIEGMGVGLGDIDEDGWIDLLLSDVDGVRLFQKRGDPYWDVTDALKVNPDRVDLGPTWGVVMGDLDLDGRNDMLAAAGRLFNEVAPENQPDYQTDQLMQALPDGTYEELDASHGFEEDAMSRALVIADFDRDGHPDLVTTSILGLQLWHNVTASPPAITLQVDGGPQNPDGIGAVVTVELGNRVLHRWIWPSATYSSMAPELYLGLDGARVADRITVQMQDGRSASVTEVEAGTVLKLRPQ